VLPGGFISAIASQALEQEQVDLVESLLANLVVAAQTDDHAVRWRACQLVQAVMDHLSNDVEFEDNGLEDLQQAMRERLDDAKPVVRAAAARALKRLVQPGEVSRSQRLGTVTVFGSQVVTCGVVVISDLGSSGCKKRAAHLLLSSPAS
jgi:hypothetical protein